MADDLYRPRTRALWTGGTWLFLFAIGASLIDSRGWAGLTYLPLLVAAGYLGWQLFWLPSVDVADVGVTIVNPFRTVSVPWPALIDVHERPSLTLITPRGRYSAWAAPSRPRRPYVESKPEVDGIAARVWGRWQSLVEAESFEVGVADLSPVAVRWHGRTLLALALLLALGVVCALV